MGPGEAAGNQGRGLPESRGLSVLGLSFLGAKVKNGGRICKRLRLLGGGDVSVPLVGPSPVAMSDVRFSCASLEDQTYLLVISV